MARIDEVKAHLRIRRIIMETFLIIVAFIAVVSSFSYTVFTAK